jgi:hypothetical protein
MWFKQSAKTMLVVSTLNPACLGVYNSEILAYLYKDLINVSDSLISKYCTPLFTWNFRNITFGCEYKHISG